jgi:hypothetical protein
MSGVKLRCSLAGQDLAQKKKKTGCHGDGGAGSAISKSHISFSEMGGHSVTWRVCCIDKFKGLFIVNATAIEQSHHHKHDLMAADTSFEKSQFFFLFSI